MLASVPVAAQTPTPDVYFVPDVVGQFNSLALTPEPFGMWVWGHPEPSDNIDKHYQGIARSQGPGLPHMFLSWNGNDSGCIDCDDEPGQLFVIRMLSRDTTGERLRSNRLYPGHPIRGFQNGIDVGTPPDLSDCLVARIVFDGTGDWPHYRHPGAMQVVGDVLAVPLSKPGAGDEPMRIQFIDISEPAVPSPLSSFVVTGGNSNFGAGLVALTPVQNPSGPGQRYLMAIAGEGGQELRLYRSLSTDPDDEDAASDLKSGNLQWEEINSFTGTELGSFWPCCSSQSHQTLNFVREGTVNGTLDGALYLIGAFNDTSVIFPGGGTDFFTLYRVNVDVHGNPESPLLTHIKKLHVTTNSIAGDTAHFTGSTGVYVSPTGELIIYANEHEEQGPYGLDPISGELRKSVRAGEWRHRAMVRPDSPTLQPSVAPTGVVHRRRGRHRRHRRDRSPREHARLAATLPAIPASASRTTTSMRTSSSTTTIAAWRTTTTSRSCIRASTTRRAPCAGLRRRAAASRWTSIQSMTATSPVDPGSCLVSAPLWLPRPRTRSNGTT